MSAGRGSTGALRCSASPGARTCRIGLGRRRRCLRGLELFRRAVGIGSAALAPRRAEQRQHQIALIQLVANLDRDGLHRAGRGAGDLHGRLVAFQRQYGLVHIDAVAGADQDLDDRDIGEVADIRQTHRDLGWRGGCRLCRRS